MKVKAEQTWAWMLFEDDASLYLTALYGSVVIYSVNFKLSQAEADNFTLHGNSYLAELSREISQSPDSYRQRHISAFDSLPGVLEAIAAWRGHMSAVS